MNPTAKQDAINAALPIGDQLPKPGPTIRTIDTPEAEDLQLYPTRLDTDYTTYRCKVAVYTTLKDAQAFFATLRAKYHWQEEAPIFRTAMYWIKRAIPGRGDK